MVGLRHLWTMSNYFCRDETMQILLHKISYVFTEKVKMIISLQEIFKYVKILINFNSPQL